MVRTLVFGEKTLVLPTSSKISSTEVYNIWKSQLSKNCTLKEFEESLRSEEIRFDSYISQCNEIDGGGRVDVGDILLFKPGAPNVVAWTESGKAIISQSATSPGYYRVNEVIKVNPTSIVVDVTKLDEHGLYPGMAFDIFTSIMYQEYDFDIQNFDYHDELDTSVKGTIFVAYHYPLIGIGHSSNTNGDTVLDTFTLYYNDGNFDILDTLSFSNASDFMKNAFRHGMYPIGKNIFQTNPAILKSPVDSDNVNSMNRINSLDPSIKSILDFNSNIEINGEMYLSLGNNISRVCDLCDVKNDQYELDLSKFIKIPPELAPHELSIWLMSNYGFSSNIVNVSIISPTTIKLSGPVLHGHAQNITRLTDAILNIIE